MRFTIVQSYTGKYHKFVAVCIVIKAQPSNNANNYKRVILFLVYIALFYGDNDFIIRTFEFIDVQTKRM